LFYRRVQVLTLGVIEILVEFLKMIAWVLILARFLGYV
jgi:hypothetical protein